MGRRRAAGVTDLPRQRDAERRAHVATSAGDLRETLLLARACGWRIVAATRRADGSVDLTLAQ